MWPSHLALVILGVCLVPLVAAHRAQVTGARCSTYEGVAAEIEVTSADLFPVRNALVELAVGPVVTSLSRYGDDGDLHTLIFMFTRDQLPSLGPSDAAVVRFNPGSDYDTWLIGPLDPQVLGDLVRCSAAE
jgi:hypothetical protein